MVTNVIKVKWRPNLRVIRQRFGKGVKVLREMPHRRIAVFLDQWVQKNFKGEGQAVGGWAPFQAGGRWRKGFGIDATAKLLQDTGALRASFLPFASKRDAGIGSLLPYSKSHEKGEGALPVRRMLPKFPEVEDDVEDIFVEHVKEGLEKMTR